MEKILALDLGVTSIGYAVVNKTGIRGILKENY